MTINFGYEYPAGADDDANAPWNFIICEGCESDVNWLDEDGICETCLDNADVDEYCEVET